MMSVLTVCASTAIFGVASAQTPPMTEEQINRIKASCTSAKSTLNQLHASDALLRVNRGQIYESMSSKLMTRFNSRAQSNRYSVDDLVSVAQNYSTALTTFKQDYRLYEEQLSTSLRIDCSKEPVTFFDAVMSARAKRSQVHVDVIKLHQYIDEYQSGFTTFVANFNTNKESN
jgi:ribosome-binding protein aMBF1 (putative translation factor)